MFSILSSLKQFFGGGTDSKSLKSANNTSACRTKQEAQAEARARYLQNTLDFAKQQHHILDRKQREKEHWQRQYGRMKAAELKQMSGTEFEEYLAGLFRLHGYQVDLTPTTGDYGADLLIMKQGQRIAVQAKCYTGSVGISAVQEALSGMAYYQCQSAWVVTTGTFTPNAFELARKSQVQLLDSTELGKLIIQVQK